MNDSSDYISKKLEVLDAAYKSVLDPDSFDLLVEAWDQTYLQEIFLEKLENANLGLSLNEIEQHFERALLMKPATPLHSELTVQDLVEKEPLPTFAISKDKRALSKNKAMSLVDPDNKIGSSDDLADFFGDDLIVELNALLKPNNGQEKQSIIQSYGADDKVFLFYASKNEPGSLKSGDTVLLVRIIETVWTQKLNSMLSQTFNLTDAEIETTRLLTLGHNATQISGIRNRSLDTVRNQIRSILAKTQANGQTELIRMLTLINQISVDTAKWAEEPDKSNEVLSDRLIKNTITLVDNRKLEYARYGALGSRVLIYVTTSSLPEENLPFRELVLRHGFDVIAPYRPGFGNSDIASHDNSLDGFVDDCLQLIKKLGLTEVHVAGHREGGIFATSLARALKKNALSLTIINTGAPVQDWKKLHAGSLAARRSLAAAIKAPKALAVGYRLAVRIFNSGVLGEAKILDFFYSGSPIDAATYTDPSLREVTRRNIAHCFENSDYIVSDIALWASDWSDALRDVCEHTKVLFIHAQEHDFMLADWVKQLCKEDHQMNCKIVQMSGQTMLYTHARQVLKYLDKHAR